MLSTATSARRRAASLLLALVIGLVATACDRGWRDEPFPHPSRSAGDPTGPRLITVAPGDSVYAIARRQGVPMRAIIVANDLRPPYAVQPGQRLFLPAQRVHTVTFGDTLYGLSRTYGPSVAAIANANGLAPPYGIQAGQRLVIPVDPAPPAATGGVAPLLPPRPAPRNDGAVALAPLVAPVAPAPLAAPIPAWVPDGETPPAARPAASPAIASDGTPVPPRRPSGQTASRPASAPVAGVSPAPAPVPVPPPPPRAGDRFQWPVQGEVIGRFGGSDQGLHNDGINIAVPEGTPVRAADTGVVAYAGNEIQGFGTLILIKHADGWMTAYAHASRLEVRRGDTVRRGQVIARAGRTGSVDRPQLHFEVRRDARPVDPMDHLGPPGRV
ncbi:LysM peptidoglycan-binding domain-containing M23 family metallopeptidase [Roseospira visakhapatnamensis]|uniref:Murein DD-endopeptidase MepM/ murein hydrolase activator NlpD n=1 Tax=Roseospira visakhapatnamensis TaxID=390880 RepID=A0A7W6WAC6_9PROT|nr:LysM peptidoglycan-binding domain-containing M23 family metallopeptidase [Roseospira visakhapatnamensis]MBB4266718.1 murein DD-endopeptidase MepM/ murein hydrolase activator NlpD [Roseospira visakhapatnamensis]